LTIPAKFENIGASTTKVVSGQSRLEIWLLTPGPLLLRGGEGGETRPMTFHVSLIATINGEDSIIHIIIS
jgi:hypothetical protein